MGAKVGRGLRRDLDAGPFQALIDSFEIHLLAERKSAKTVRTYTEAAQWFAAAQLRPARLDGWEQVTAKDVQRWIASLAARYSGAYASIQFRASAVLQVVRHRRPGQPAAEPYGRPAPAEGRRNGCAATTRSCPCSVTPVCGCRSWPGWQ
jgi:hypothetical protein